MTKKTLLLFCLLGISIAGHAQKERYFARNMITGTSFTWKPFNNTDPAVIDRFNEYTWNVNAAVSLNKRIYLGLQLLNVYTNGTMNSLEKYRVYGMFVQFNMLKQTEHRFFLESSINRGNYCTCGDGDPIRKDNLYYLGLGMGYDLPLRKFLRGLYLDLSFINYLILSPVEDRYAYTQYVIGLNYRFGK